MAKKRKMIQLYIKTPPSINTLKFVRLLIKLRPKTYNKWIHNKTQTNLQHQSHLPFKNIVAFSLSFRKLLNRKEIDVEKSIKARRYFNFKIYIRQYYNKSIKF